MYALALSALLIPTASAETCPDPGDFDDAVIEVTTYNPCLLDPAVVNLCSEDPLLPDTHDYGRRLHRVMYRTDIETPRPQLLLWLAAGPGEQQEQVLSWGAFAGYRTIGLGYDNRGSVFDRCWLEPLDCHGNHRNEIVTGEDTSPWADIGPADSIEGRLYTLLDHLALVDAGAGWADFLDGSEIAWDRIVVGGWSEGSGHSAFIAGRHAVDGVVLVGGPRDGNMTTGAPRFADWLYEPRATPGCVQFGVYHTDHLPGPGPVHLNELAWDALGVPLGTTDLDTVPFPYGGVHRLSTSINVPGCNPHELLSRDNCVPRELFEPYLYLYCNAGDADPATCGS